MQRPTPMKTKQTENSLYSTVAFDDDNSYANDNDDNIPKMILHIDFCCMSIYCSYISYFIAKPKLISVITKSQYAAKS